jgi:hypothetical protein
MVGILYYHIQRQLTRGESEERLLVEKFSLGPGRSYIPSEIFSGFEGSKTQISLSKHSGFEVIFRKSLSNMADFRPREGTFFFRECQLTFCSFESANYPFPRKVRARHHNLVATHFYFTLLSACSADLSLFCLARHIYLSAYPP